MNSNDLIKDLRETATYNGAQSPYMAKLCREAAAKLNRFLALADELESTIPSRGDDYLSGRVMMFTWELDEWGCWNHRGDCLGIRVHVHICPRPSYCDRGHWQANIDGPLGLDSQDGFPRYFMDIDHAKAEMEEFAYHRCTAVLARGDTTAPE